MRSYQLVATLALYCFGLIAVAANGSSSNLGEALARAPDDEQETAGLDGESERYKPFCVSYRNHIIDDIKHVGQAGVALQLADLIYPDTKKGLYNIESALDTVEHDTEAICDRIGEYKLELRRQFEEFKGEISSQTNIDDHIRLEQVDCVTSDSVLELFSVCSVVRDDVWTRNFQ